MVDGIQVGVLYSRQLVQGEWKGQLTLGAFLGEENRGIQVASLVEDLASLVGIRVEVVHKPWGVRPLLRLPVSFLASLTHYSGKVTLTSTQRHSSSSGNTFPRSRR